MTSDNADPSQYRRGNWSVATRARVFTLEQSWCGRRARGVFGRALMALFVVLVGSLISPHGLAQTALPSGDLSPTTTLRRPYEAMSQVERKSMSEAGVRVDLADSLMQVDAALLMIARCVDLGLSKPEQKSALEAFARVTALALNNPPVAKLMYDRAQALAAVSNQVFQLGTPKHIAESCRYMSALGDEARARFR